MHFLSEIVAQFRNKISSVLQRKLQTLAKRLCLVFLCPKSVNKSAKKSSKMWFNFLANREHNLLSETLPGGRGSHLLLENAPTRNVCAPREENVSTNFQNSQFSTNVVETFDGYVIQNQTLGIRLEF